MLTGLTTCGCVAFTRKGVLFFLAQLFLQFNEGILTYMLNYLLKGIAWKNWLTHYRVIFLLVKQ
jgi:hypothetical protein